MATVRLLGSTFNTTSGTHTVVAAPRAGELIVIVVANTGNVAQVLCADNNADGLGTYVTAKRALKATSVDEMLIQVRAALVGSPTSTTFTNAPGTTTGGGLAVFGVQGMLKTGAAAALQTANQDNQGAATPAPAFGSTPKLSNPVIAAAFTATNPAALTPRAGYTESVDTGFATPATGIEIMVRDEGETSATLTWGSASSSAFCSAAVELDAILMGVPENYRAVKVGNGMSASERIR